MDKDTKIKLIEISNLLDNIGWDLSDAKTQLENLEYKLQEQENKTIKDINNFKRELKRDGLYSEKLEEFLEQYMLYYNK